MIVRLRDITPAGYVLIYYFLPLSVQNPLYAHKLSLVGFWSLALFYPFVGIHHYLDSRIADWAEAAGDRHLHAVDHSGVDGARELLRHREGSVGRFRETFSRRSS